MNDKVMYSQAREVAEPELCSALKRAGMEDVRQSGKLDDVNHIDVFASKNGIQWIFDVKDLSPSYAGKSSNYNMSETFLTDVKKDGEKYKHHMIACRLYGRDGKPLGKFACFKTTDVVEKGLVKKMKRRDNGKEFWLFNAEEAMATLANGKQWKVLQ